MLLCMPTEYLLIFCFFLQRAYYGKLGQVLPKDTMLLTLGCGKVSGSMVHACLCLHAICLHCMT